MADVPLWRVEIVRIGDRLKVHLHLGDPHVSMPGSESFRLSTALRSAAFIAFSGVDKWNDSTDVVPDFQDGGGTCPACMGQGTVKPDPDKPAFICELCLGRKRYESMEELIEKSSFGTPEAKAIRARTPRHVRDEIMARLAAGWEKDADV